MLYQIKEEKLIIPPNYNTDQLIAELRILKNKKKHLDKKYRPSPICLLLGSSQFGLHTDLKELYEERKKLVKFIRNNNLLLLEDNNCVEKELKSDIKWLRYMYSRPIIPVIKYLPEENLYPDNEKLNYYKNKCIRLILDVSMKDNFYCKTDKNITYVYINSIDNINSSLLKAVSYYSQYLIISVKLLLIPSVLSYIKLNRSRFLEILVLDFDFKYMKIIQTIYQ